VRKNLTRTGIRSPGRPARSESPYRLSYCGTTKYPHVGSLFYLTHIIGHFLPLYRARVCGRRVCYGSRICGPKGSDPRYGEETIRILYILRLCVCVCVCVYIYIYIYISKAVPLQACSGPEGCRKLRFTDFMTTAQDAGKVVSLTQRPPLPPGNAPGTHFC